MNNKKNSLPEYFVELRDKIIALREAKKDLVKKMIAENGIAPFAENAIEKWLDELATAVSYLRYYYVYNENTRAISEETFLPFAHNFDLLNLEREKLQDKDWQQEEISLYNSAINTMYRELTLPSSGQINSLAEIRFKRLLSENALYTNSAESAEMMTHQDHLHYWEPYTILVSWQATSHVRGSMPTIFFLEGKSDSLLTDNEQETLKELVRSIKNGQDMGQMMYRIDRDTKITPTSMRYLAITNYFPSSPEDIVLSTPIQEEILAKTRTLLLMTGKKDASGTMEVDTEIIQSAYKKIMQTYQEAIPDALYGEAEQTKLFCGEFIQYQSWYNATKKKFAFVSVK